MSQIKVPVTLPSQPVSKTLLTSNSAGTLQTTSPAEKRRKIELVNRRNTTSNITLVNNSQQTKARRLLTTTNNAVTTQIVVEDSSVSLQFRVGPILQKLSVAIRRDTIDVWVHY